MIVERELFERLRPDPDKLVEYGFQKEGGTFLYRKSLGQGGFYAEITVRGSTLSGKVMDEDTEEEYIQVHLPGQHGEFAAKISEAYLAVLEEIAEQCFSPVEFISDQANRIAGQVYDRYGVTPDHPFAKAQSYAVFRHPGNKKWFGLIMDIDRKVLEKTEGKIDILNLKVTPETYEEALKLDGIYPAYHMNKKQWITIVLDERIGDEKILEFVEESYRLSNGPSKRKAGRQAWLIPASPKMYDVGRGFRTHGNSLDWHQRIDVRNGDLVFIYMTAPVSSIIYGCEVKKAGIVDEDGVRRMRLYMFREFEPGRYPLSMMKEYGITGVRGARRMTDELYAVILPEIEECQTAE